MCAVLGCGGGKSIIQGMISKSATDKGNRVLFLVHRKELCSQIEQTFKRCGVNFDLCQIGMVQTVTRRLSKIPEPNLIITDEAHHALSNSYRRIYDYFPNSTRLGFTATPIRMNEGGLGDVFESIVEGVSTKWLIKNNYLAPYKYYSVQLADITGVHTRRGDFDSSEIAEIMEQSKIYGGTTENWLKLADGKQTIVYCASVKSSKETAEQFNKCGINAKHLDGTTPKLEREQAVQDFRDGKITVLCNVDLFGEGFDVPDCEAVVLLRPTKSLTLFIQQSMRSMRYKPGKTAIIIDHVGNIFRHDFPDSSHEWSLKTKKSKAKTTVKIRQCPVCLSVYTSGTEKCDECGYVFEKSERADITAVDGSIVEITHEEILKAKPYDYYKKIKDFETLKMFQKAKKYKFAWCLHKAIELGIPIPSKYNQVMRHMRI